MKNILLFLTLALGACNLKPEKAACYRLETCETNRHGEALCVRGVGASGKDTGEVHLFLSRDMLEAWSQLHPEARACQ